MYSLEQELSVQDIDYIKNKFEENVQAVNAGLEHYLNISGSAEYANLIESMRYSTLSGGKRIRGFLTRECFAIFNGYCDDEIILPVACAVEIIHAYSLIHDDLPCMDNDDMRRGQPTNHKKFGEAAAVLAGDALLAFAFNILADAEKIIPDIKVKIISEISRAAGHSGMVGGQTMDINYANNKNIKIDVIRLIKLHTLKTGALITAAARAGCIAAGAGKDELGLISDYAKNIGLAFQVTDDLFDGDGFVKLFGNTEDAVEYARSLTLDALLKLEKLKELNAEINVKSLEAAAKYLLYREY